MPSLRSAVLALLAFPLAAPVLGQSVLVSPSKGTVATRFVVTTAFPACPCDFHSTNFSIDGTNVSATAPFSLDTLAVSIGLGQHIVRANYVCECPPDYFVTYDVRDTFTVLTHDPVLLVHGICGAASSWFLFDAILSDSGFVVDRLQYGSADFSDPPDAYVPMLEAKIDLMDCDKVAVVAHSMGALMTREFLKREAARGGPGRPVRVSQLVTLGTPHHGTDLAARLLSFRTWLNLGSTIRFPGTIPYWDPTSLTELLGCQGDSRSMRALRHLEPGSPYLNRLNYGDVSALYDPPLSRGWDSHAAELLAPGTYYASIAGTKSSCFGTDIPIWGYGGSYHANDGAVATASALLANSQTFRAQDVQLPTAQVTHAAAPLLCGVPYYSLAALGEKVARILRTSPANPPVSVPSEQSPRRLSTLAVAEDSLRATPAIVDTISPGVVDLPTRTIPTTTLMLVTLVSDDARLTLMAPNGAIITPSDTSTASGIAYFGQTGSGFEGYRIGGPQPGSWTFRIDATAGAALQNYGCLVEYASVAETRVSARDAVIYDGDLIRIRAEVAIAGLRQLGVSWVCRVFGPNNSTHSLALFDDGAHGDSLLGDGIYGNSVAPGDGFGLYRVGATATLLTGESFDATGSCELAHLDDLSVPAENIWFSPNVFNPGDSVTVHAKVLNAGLRIASDATIDVQDLRIGVSLGTRTVTIPATGEVMIQVPWFPAAPDTHEIEVSVRPYVFEAESNYANNVASRIVVLGTPVSVGPQQPGFGKLSLSQPLPNPSGGFVTFAFELPARGDAALELFDVHGRRIRRWILRDLSAGPHRFEWDGRNRAGVMQPPGLVICRLSAGGDTRNRKLVLRP